MLAGDRPVGQHSLDGFELVHLIGQRIDHGGVQWRLTFAIFRRRCQGRADFEQFPLNEFGALAQVSVLADGARETHG